MGTSWRVLEASWDVLGAFWDVLDLLGLPVLVAIEPSKMGDSAVGHVEGENTNLRLNPSLWRRTGCHRSTEVRLCPLALTVTHLGGIATPHSPRTCENVCLAHPHHLATPTVWARWQSRRVLVTLLNPPCSAIARRQGRGAQPVRCRFRQPRNLPH